MLASMVMSAVRRKPSHVLAVSFPHCEGWDSRTLPHVLPCDVSDFFKWLGPELLCWWCKQEGEEKFERVSRESIGDVNRGDDVIGGWMLPTCTCWWCQHVWTQLWSDVAMCPCWWCQHDRIRSGWMLPHVHADDVSMCEPWVVGCHHVSTRWCLRKLPRVSMVSGD